MENVTFARNGIVYSVDFYVELLGVLSILCEDQDSICEAGAVRCNGAYAEEVKAFFAHSDWEKLTQMLSDFSETYYFNYDAPVQLMLHLSSGVPVDREALFYQREYIPDELWDAFLEALQKFEQESGFSKFYEAHIPMYRELLERFAADYAQYDSHGFLFRLLHAEQKDSCCINLMVGITNGNYGVHMGNRVYANLRPFWKSRFENLPDYSYSPIYYSTLIVHEFAHAFINDMTGAYRDRISRIPVEKYGQVLDNFCYGDSVETLINETVISAIECLYVRARFPEQYRAYVQEYVEDGYLLLPQTIRILDSCADIPGEYVKIVELFEA